MTRLWCWGQETGVQGVVAPRNPLGCQFNSIVGGINGRVVVV